MKPKKEDLNTLIKLSNRVLKLAYVFLIIIVAYAIVITLKETGILKLFFNFLLILSPLFIGIAIAWIFDPAVKFFIRKGRSRLLGAIIVFVIFFSLLIGFFSVLIPAFSSQIEEFSKTIPAIVNSFELWVDNFFERFSGIEGFNHLTLKADVLAGIEAWGKELPQTLPMLTFNFMKALINGLGIFVLSLVVGFYVLISYENATDVLHVLTPAKYKTDVSDFARELNDSLRGYVKGTGLLSLFIFITTYIAFSILGLKGALIFALLCGLTNIIPYVGPWIGGIIAAIVGATQSLTLGFLIILSILIIQSVESVIMHPILMGKSTKIHPVTIILGLLVFGHYFGIVGMILATPIIAFLKVVIHFLNRKINFLGMIQ